MEPFSPFHELMVNDLVQVFPLKSELLRPPDVMERHITDLIKKVCLLSPSPVIAFELVIFQSI